MSLVELFVNGTLMRGLELHATLSEATFIGERETAPTYRLFSIDDRYPGMVYTPEGGAAIRGELYGLDLELLEQVLAGEPPGLGIGVVRLSGGHRALGVLWVDGPLPADAEEITVHRGWRAFKERKDEA
jgi:AGZA family xanthine/uracil permease-like MFS transporter